MTGDPMERSEGTESSGILKVARLMVSVAGRSECGMIMHGRRGAADDPLTTSVMAMFLTFIRSKAAPWLEESVTSSRAFFDSIPSESLMIPPEKLQLDNAIPSVLRLLRTSNALRGDF